MNLHSRSCPKLAMEALEEEEVLSLFSPLLQEGVGVRARVGIPILELLLQGFDLPSEYVRQKIQTVFLNGTPVDDLHGAFVHSGDTVALSAAMPGLVGAILRSSSPLASLRTQVASESPRSEQPESGWVQLKLFNRVILELGLFFLTRGVLVEGKELALLLSGAPDSFWNQLRAVRLQGKPLEAIEDLPGRLSQLESVLLEMQMQKAR